MSPSRGGEIWGESGEGDREIWGPYQEPQLAGAGEGLHAAVHVELGVQLLQVPLDGAGRHDQFMGHLHIRLTSGQQAQHSQFALFEKLNQRLVPSCAKRYLPQRGAKCAGTTEGGQQVLEIGRRALRPSEAMAVLSSEHLLKQRLHRWTLIYEEAHVPFWLGLRKRLSQLGKSLCGVPEALLRERPEQQDLEHAAAATGHLCCRAQLFERFERVHRPTLRDTHAHKR